MNKLRCVIFLYFDEQHVKNIPVVVDSLIHQQYVKLPIYVFYERCSRKYEDLDVYISLIQHYDVHVDVCDVGSFEYNLELFMKKNKFGHVFILSQVCIYDNNFLKDIFEGAYRLHNRLKILVIVNKSVYDNNSIKCGILLTPFLYRICTIVQNTFYWGWLIKMIVRSYEYRIGFFNYTNYKLSGVRCFAKCTNNAVDG